jgi:hypothetical protein
VGSTRGAARSTGRCPGIEIVCRVWLTSGVEGTVRPKDSMATERGAVQLLAALCNSRRHRAWRHAETNGRFELPLYESVHPADPEHARLAQLPAVSDAQGQFGRAGQAVHLHWPPDGDPEVPGGPHYSRRPERLLSQAYSRPPGSDGLDQPDRIAYAAPDRLEASGTNTWVARRAYSISSAKRAVFQQRLNKAAPE